MASFSQPKLIRGRHDRSRNPGQGATERSRAAAEGAPIAGTSSSGNSMANSHSAVTRLVVLGATGIEPLLPTRWQIVAGHSGTAGLLLDDSVVSRRQALNTFS